MARKKNIVVFIHDHTVIHPATVLEIHCGDTVTHVADIPESRTEYKVDQKLEFSTKKEMHAFLKAINVEKLVACGWSE